MAGIYIHIPFCKQACNYCNFYFSTSLEHKNELIEALLQEIEHRKDYLESKQIDTIYFGGGTPSLLSSDELEKIFDKIVSTFDVHPLAEITLEANPDDLHKEKLKAFKQSPINRFSIGIQSFMDDDLQYMNRAHTSIEAIESIYRTQDAGFENISIDLIYGTPTLSNSNWNNNILKAINTQVPHISAYALTVEQHTKLDTLIRKKILAPVDEVKSSEQFIHMIELLETNAFEQYEISNFCKNEQISKHNSSYWKGIPYIGIGPSAHSFDGRSRSWNPSSNMKYVQGIRTKMDVRTTEVLTRHDVLNEQIMTGIRTKWGINLMMIENTYGKEVVEEMQYNLQENAQQSWYRIENNVLTLTKEGKLFADKIASDLFFDSSEEGELFSL
jgi:oxygen-independent coproporphyrinogen-3 oxidase